MRSRARGRPPFHGEPDLRPSSLRPFPGGRTLPRTGQSTRPPPRMTPAGSGVESVPRAMAHHGSRSVYDRLTGRLNRFPQGAPPSETLYRILQLLFSEREADLVAVLPIRPFTAARPPRIWKMPRGRGARGARRARLPGHPRRLGAERRHRVRAAAAHGRLLRVLDDAGAQRRRPEGARRALLPVPERGGGLRPRPLRRRRDPARPGLRAGAGPHRGERAARARLRARQRGHPHRHAPRDLPLLLPPQDGARGAGLRRPRTSA